MKRTATVVALLLTPLLPPLASITGSAGVARAAETVRLDAATEARAGIRTEPIAEESFGDQVRLVGQTVRSPGTTMTIKPLLEGKIERVFVAPGDRVERGSALVSIRSHELLDLRGRYLQAVEAQRLAETRVRAGEQLLELEGISRIELEQRRQHALAARIEVQSLEAELEHLGFRQQELPSLLEASEEHPRLTLRAPAAGVVLDLEVEVHGWVERYQPLLVLGDPEKLELELQLPPDQASSVAPGDEVLFVPVGRPGQEGRARIITRVPRVDPVTRTVTLRAKLVEGSRALLPGLFVEGSLIRGGESTALSVPETAVIRIAGKDCVFVRSGDGAYEMRPVRAGRFDGSRYEILSGVSLGEQVVVEGVFLLKSALLRQGSEEE